MILAWIPFLQPIPELVAGWYLLCVPLVLGVAMVYKAVWIPQDGQWMKQVIVMVIWMMVGLVGLAIALAVFTEFIIPSLQ